MSNGIVYLVGAGPGDPGLITVRGVECLKNADIVIYDYLANEQLLNLAPSSAERIYAGKIGGRHNQDQSEINKLLIDKALLGKRVVRLKGGDPFVFGRGGEECEALKDAGIRYEIVPGVTAALGAAAYSGIPLTHRDFTTSVAFVTGQESKYKDESEIDWERLSLGGGTVVFYMGVTNLRHNMQKMIEHGRSPDTGVALIRWGTTRNQETITGTVADIADIAEKTGFKPPAITVVGNVVSLREKLRWFDNRPLSGLEIIVTRAADQAGQFSSMLAEKGAFVHECPTIELIEPNDWFDLDEAISNISTFNWLILTSFNAVHFFFKRLYALGYDSRSLSNCKICTVGSKTALELNHYGIVPDLIPKDYKAEGVVEQFTKIDLTEKKILFPHADLAREFIPLELTKLGAEVIAPVAYRNVMPERLNPETIFALEKRSVDCITFTSSSTVRNLVQMLGNDRLVDMLKGVTVASIGPITTKTCHELGLKVDIEPQIYTLEALISEIEKYFKNNPRI